MGKIHSLFRKYLLAVLFVCLLTGCGKDILNTAREKIFTENKSNENDSGKLIAKEENSAVIDKILQETAADNDLKVEQGESADSGTGTIEANQSISAGNYAYENLDEEGRLVYDQMLSAILLFEEKAELKTMDADVMSKAYTALNRDYGSLFWTKGYELKRYTRGTELVGLEFLPIYTMTKEEQKEIQKQIDEVVDQWLSGISITDSDYEKAKYVFETLINNVDYAEDAEDSQNIISVFLNRETVCQGYACATQYLLKHLGIPSMVVSGLANGQSHAWNIVYLDGNYYHMDTTWGNSSYLDAESRESKFVNHNYLCMTTDEILLTHSPSTELLLPECTAIEDNYYVREGRYFDSWEPELIGGVLGEAWNNGDESVSLKFSDDELYEQARDYFIIGKKFSDYCSGLTYIYYLEEKDLRVLTINFN